jgi:protein SCO1/2
MHKFRLLKKIIILGLILALPGFLYYLLTEKGKNRYRPLPILGPKHLATTSHKFHGKIIPDTIFHTIADFNLIDQDGKPISFKNFKKKILVVNFFYTNCPTLCHTVNANVDSLSENYGKNKMVYFASVTVDPQRDNGEVLKDYANKNTPLSPKRLFLTGDTSTIYNLARKGLLVDALQTGENDFIYSNKLILVDSERRIRGYYSGELRTEAARLNDEIKVLIAEELRKNDKPLY